MAYIHMQEPCPCVCLPVCMFTSVNGAVSAYNYATASITLEAPTGSMRNKQLEQNTIISS